MKDAVRRKHLNELKELGEWLKKKRNGDNPQGVR